MSARSGRCSRTCRTSPCGWPTLFRYFPAKEDLVLHRIADHEAEAARVVAGAADPVDALRRHFLAGLERRDPVTGLNDHPQVLAFHTLLFGTPALVARAYGHLERSEAALAEALGGGLDARLAAGQIIAVQRILAEDNWRRVAAGEPVDEVAPQAVRAAERAFRRPAAGLPDLTSELRTDGDLTLRPTGDLLGTTVAAVRDALAREGSVGVVTADADTGPVRAALTAAGLAPAGPDALGAQLAVVPASTVKGLEYDHVVAVEPAAVVEAEERGAHRLYVVLTRAVSRLDVVHTRPLPF